MAEAPEQKYCPWGNYPDRVIPSLCTQSCALYIDGQCSFAWLGRWAQEQLVEVERQEFLADARARRENP